MKALSLWHPYAPLIAIGAKKIETRSWSMRYRGPVLIHAAKKQSRGIVSNCNEVRRIMGKHQFTNPPGHYDVNLKTTLGCVLAVADLVDVIDASEKPDGLEGELGFYGPGRFGWVLSNVRQFIDPIPWQGQQGLWEVPKELLRLLPAEAALYREMKV